MGGWEDSQARSPASSCMPCSLVCLYLAGVWMNDLVQVAAHEIGHALGLWHSRDVRALMHPNATYSWTRRISQDDVWAVQRLYGTGEAQE